MRWIYRTQQYGCSCGLIVYEGGQHKARAAHRKHKEDVGAAHPKAQRRIDDLRRILERGDKGDRSADSAQARRKDECSN